MLKQHGHTKAAATCAMHTAPWPLHMHHQDSKAEMIARMQNATCLPGEIQGLLTVCFTCHKQMVNYTYVFLMTFAALNEQACSNNL